MWTPFAALMLGVQCSTAFSPLGSPYKTAAKSSLFSAATATEGTTSVAEAPVSEIETATRTSIVVCPAQFCVPGDYEVFFDNLRALNETNVGHCVVAPLPRTEWIKVARQLPTAAFWEAELKVEKTLRWYFDAIDVAIAEILAEEGPEASICLVGHSIGGWVARAYLGGLSGSSSAVQRVARANCRSLVTLGTPHSSPDDALVDQTRGLLRQIAEAPECQPQALADRGIRMTCVCSRALEGKFLTTNVEEQVAASSYFPLLGRLGAQGDGIVPLDLAFLDEPARKVILDDCTLTNLPIRHSHVVPTPWNLWNGFAPSITLPSTFPSYVSEGVLPQWARYISR